VQAMAFDFPAEFFNEQVHRIRKPRASLDEISAAAEVLRNAKRPLIMAGGGVHYSLAESVLADFAAHHGIPVMETVAGKSSLVASHPCFSGAIGVFAETAGLTVAWSPDVVLAVGTRLQDFATESGSVFKDPAVQLIGINVARFDALKRGAISVIGDAGETLSELSDELGNWSAPAAWLSSAQASLQAQQATLTERQRRTTDTLPTYAQVIGVVHEVATADDYVLTSSGGLAGELVMNWPSKSIASFDCEYGFSCMGYEFSGGWGAAMERMVSKPGSTVYTMGGDGSFMMLPMDVYSAALTGTDVTFMVCDNGGFNVIERLQIGHGAASFKTMLADIDHPTPPQLDFAAIATGMGAQAHRVTSLVELETTLREIKGVRGTHVVVIEVAKHRWSEGNSFWEVGVPEVTHRPAVDEARKELREGKSRQRQLWRPSTELEQE
jgi:3D-(3,5/4)-trihydroxycyclohexane-1,2-dione acylhydrolase (decyclizing)